ncbi:MAG TPA: V-type ATP synthase subunit I [Methanothrix sp.]|jgi:V/A-type H+-transporting ATPase subunit I|nr:V-type ATP synthase subunit I [Methanothrix sp.]HPC90184.1 V-type ATP synthase subunit I [Methanothrix sp.]HRT17548.1 V-type ATP synthase subunit I [Methanothrix sp.]
MLRPVKMSRVVVAGSKDVLTPVVEKLHELHLLHIVNYNGSEPSFELGKPIGKAREYSENLIKLRSITRYLNLKNKAPDKTFPESQILSEMDNLLNNVGADITATYERITAIDAEIKSKRDQIKSLTPLAVLPLPLEAYYGYDSLATFVGTVATPVDADVARVSPVNEIYSGSAKNATFVAVFVPVEKASEVSSVLSEHGFSEISVPRLEGSVDSAIATLEGSIKSLEGEKAPLQKKLAEMKKQYEDLMLATDEYLSMQTAKTEAPLRFAETANAFVIDGYVPSDDFPRLKSELESAADGKLDVQLLSEGETEALVEKGEDIPSKIDNPSIVRPYELITRLFAVPEYKEFDPSLLIFIFFPIMYGMILGDVGYGVMVFLVVYMLKRKFRTPGWQQLTSIVLIAAVWAVIFGFFFGEIFGPLGLWGRIMGHLPEAQIELLKEQGLYFGEGVFGSLGRLGPLGIFPMDRLATNAVLLLIGTSIFIGILHCSIGSILGIKTELNYGEKKHAYFDKLPVMLLQIFFGLLVLGLVMGQMMMVIVSAIVVVGAIVMMVMGPEGPMGLAHVPFYVSNLISYLRLLAIGLASVGLAFAANQLAFYVIMPMLSGGATNSEEFTMIAIIVGILILVSVHFINLLLGILSPFMHPLRLHYVEMFTKFYSAHGGGVEYSPFGHVRRFLKA